VAHRWSRRVGCQQCSDPASHLRCVLCCTQSQLPTFQNMVCKGCLECYWSVRDCWVVFIQRWVCFQSTCEGPLSGVASAADGRNTVRTEERAANSAAAQHHTQGACSLHTNIAVSASKSCAPVSNGYVSSVRAYHGTLYIQFIPA
jgi:hypothetical protein